MSISFYQDKWKKCKGAIPFKPNEFPSAVMSCARSGEEDPRLRGTDRCFGLSLEHLPLGVLNNTI